MFAGDYSNNLRLSRPSPVTARPPADTHKNARLSSSPDGLSRPVLKTENPKLLLWRPKGVNREAFSRWYRQLTQATEPAAAT